MANSESKEEKTRLKEARKAERAEAREASQKAREEAKEGAERLKAEQRQREADRFGKLVIEEVFGGKCVRIYSKGYVRVSGVLIGKDASPFEILKGISSSSDVAKKTGIGRAAFAVATLGANVAFTSNKRGDAYLTIATDKTTHSLHEDPPTERGMKSLHKLATAGQSILDSVGALHVSVQNPVTQASITVDSEELVLQLQKLAELHSTGVLSKSEFETAKARVLSSSGQASSTTPRPSHSQDDHSVLEVVLVAVSRNQIEIIKKVREFTNLSLREAKDLVDHPPSSIKRDCDRYLAEEIKLQLESLGAEVELR